MPTDPSGQAHTGTLGLFDDPDEIAVATAQAEEKEISRLQRQIRRQERRDKRLERKQEKSAQRVAAGRSASRLPSFLNKVFGRKTKYEAREDSGGRRSGRKEYIIVRKPPMPEPVYTAEDVDPVESLWLRECGMVKVKSKDPGGCHIVPKSVIQKSE